MLNVKVIAVIVALWGGPTLAVSTRSIQESQEKAVVVEDSFDDSYSFEQYVEKFHKKYNSAEEYHRRQAIFQQNLQAIVLHNTNNTNKNKGVSQFTMGINQFTDQLPEELPLGHDKSLKAAYNNNKHPMMLGAHTELRNVSGALENVEHRVE
jgi:Cathepsin propeptide inhibitor domain (I29)